MRIVEKTCCFLRPIALEIDLLVYRRDESLAGSAGCMGGETADYWVQVDRSEARYPGLR